MSGCRRGTKCGPRTSQARCGRNGWRSSTRRLQSTAVSTMPAPQARLQRTPPRQSPSSPSKLSPKPHLHLRQQRLRRRQGWPLAPSVRSTVPVGRHRPQLLRRRDCQPHSPHHPRKKQVPRKKLVDPRPHCATAPWVRAPVQTVLGLAPFRRRASSVRGLARLTH
jgi:hypothetical protein